jgi:hypothetical protein
MIDALRVVRYSLRDFWEEFVVLVVLNALWSLTVVLPVTPFFVLGSADLIWALAVGLVLALPLPIVSGALCFVTNQVARGKTAQWGMFAAGLRRYWVKSLAVAGINLVVLFLIATNIQFYGFILEGTWTNFALSAWLVVGMYWLIAQIFWFPMILEMESEKLLLGLRNALAMVLVSPVFSLTLAIVVAVLGLLCVILSVPAVLIMASLLLLIGNHATRSRLAHVKKKPYRPGMIEED